MLSASFGVCVLSLFTLFIVCSFSKPMRDVMDANNGMSALNYLTQYGYLKVDARAGRLRTKKELLDAIRMFQLLAGIPVTGKVDNKTMEMMQTERCGMPDFGRSDNNRRRRRKRYAIQGSTWDKKALTYMYDDSGPTSKISLAEVKVQMDRAFKEWERNSGLSFTETSESTADILIRFKSGYHDDGYPFDGAGGTLAHGFYPLDGQGLSGDVHFDDDETWVLNGDKEGTDFYWTALHEIGHALGLDHSNYPDAVMYPFYSGFKEDLKLNKDDIGGIHYLYGMPAMEIHTAAPITVSSGSAPTKFRILNPCKRSFDAVFTDTSLTYFMSGEYYWTVDKDEVTLGPYVIKEMWPNLPDDGVDAAYQSGGVITFFKGPSCWKYKGRTLLKGPENITSSYGGMESSLESIDAAFVWGANGKTYLFRGEQYWRYNDALGMVDMGYPVNSSKSWHGVPSNIDSAMTWFNGKSYFFKGGDYWEFDNVNFRVKTLEPKSVHTHWMKCNRKQMTGGNNAVGLTSTFVTIIATMFALFRNVL